MENSGSLRRKAMVLPRVITANSPNPTVIYQQNPISPSALRVQIISDQKWVTPRTTGTAA